MEIGAATAVGIPVYASAPALDITLGEYVTYVPSMAHAVDQAKMQSRVARPAAHVLLDPAHSIEETQKALDRLRPTLMGSRGDGKAAAERSLRDARSVFSSAFGLK